MPPKKGATYALRPKNSNHKKVVAAGVKADTVRDINEKKYTQSEAARRLGVGKDVVSKWMKKAKYGLFNHGVAHRPTDMDEEDKLEFIQSLIKNKQKSKDKKQRQHVPKLLEIINNRSRQRGGPGLKEDLSQSFLARLEDSKLFDVGGATQAKTEARAREEASLRNFVSLGVAFEATAKGMDKHLILNMDMTGFAVLANADAKQHGHLWHVKNEDDVSVASTTGHSALPIGVKYFCLGNAAGFAANPVLIVACASMKEDECACYRVSGLSGHNGSGGFGWLVCMKTRTPNAKFFDWFIRTVVIPFVEEQRANFELNLNEEQKHPKHALLMLDGEQIQLNLFDDERLRKALLDAGIHCIKGPASTTAKTQGLDCGFIFCNLKRAVAYFVPDWENSTALDNILRRCLRDRGLVGGELSKLVHALRKITCALRKVMNAEVMSGGFKNVGVFPYNRSKILNRCTDPPTGMDMESIEAGWEALVDEFRRTGHNEEATFDRLNIRPDTGNDKRKAPKDKRSCTHERCVFLTHDGSIDRRLDWLATHPSASNGRNAKKAPKKKKAPSNKKRAKKAREDEEEDVDEMVVDGDDEEDDASEALDELNEEGDDEDDQDDDLEADEGFFGSIFDRVLGKRKIQHTTR